MSLMKLHIHATLRKLLMLLSVALCFSLFAHSQSLKKLSMALPPELFSFGNTERIEKLFTYPLHTSSDKLIEKPNYDTDVMSDKDTHSQLYEEIPFTVTARTTNYLCVKWNDGTQLELRKLFRWGKNVLAVIRSTQSPMAVSVLQIFDYKGNDVTKQFIAPSLQVDSLYKNTSTLTQQQKTILSTLPVYLTFAPTNGKYLSVTLTKDVQLLPVEEEATLAPFCSGESVLFKWTDKGFVRKS